MARVKINPPKNFVFYHQLVVRVTDLNYGNHLANENLLAYAQEVRVNWLAKNKKSELDFWGTSLIQGDAAIVYKSEGFLGNLITIGLAVEDLGNSSFDLVCEMYNETTKSPLALVKTGMVCFNYDNRKVNPVPQEFKDFVNG